MTNFAPTLWHLLGLVKIRRRVDRRVPGPRRAGKMQQRYADLVDEMKQAYGVRVRRWRTSTTGCAWVVQYHDGSTSRLIEAPYPKGPVSCAVFLHEIGHHAIGFNTHRLRCLEEYDAWRWALETMRTKGLNVTDAVTKRMDDAIRYALRKARRRGLKSIPEELRSYAV